VLVEVRRHEQRRRGQAHLGVPWGGRTVVERAEVAVAVDQRHPQREVLGEPDERVVDGAVAVRVELAHDLAHDPGRLHVPPVRTQPHLVHLVEDPPLHGLEAVAGVRQRAGVDDRVGVFQEGALHLGGDVDVDDLLLHGRRRGAASGHAGHCPPSSGPARAAAGPVLATARSPWRWHAGELGCGPRARTPPAPAPPPLPSRPTRRTGRPTSCCGTGCRCTSGPSAPRTPPRCRPCTCASPRCRSTTASSPRWSGSASATCTASPTSTTTTASRSSSPARTGSWRWAGTTASGPTSPRSPSTSTTPSTAAAWARCSWSTSPRRAASGASPASSPRCSPATSA